MPDGPSHPGEPLLADIQAAQAGERGAAARLTAALLPRVRNLVRYLIRGDRDVDDVVQEGLVAVLRGLASYRAEGAFRSWADRVVARTTFHWLERRKVVEERAHELSDEALPLELGGELDDYLQRRRLVAALDQLPLDQRHALVLHHVLELSVPEIAAETRAPLETVRSRLRLGRSRLREALTPSTQQRVS